ncbi:MAG: hypothetical protein JWM11_764, partial [Planctomycetaceae bacterium]|nr:hypothetical protein [Planctomycetaceae bacterium]
GFAAELCQRNFVTKVTSIAVSQSASITTLTIQGFTNQIVKEQHHRSDSTVARFRTASAKTNSLKSKHSDNLRCGCVCCVAAIRE